MLVDLRTLKDNPFRDFKIDPIDDAVVDRLTASIEEDGFWTGVVCRQVNGHFEIAAGHHRRLAALKAGISAADVYVGEYDDRAMIRVYARENATQRGNTGTAMAGSVASAVRFLVKASMTGNLGRILPRSQKAEDTIRGEITSGDGLGKEPILEFLENVPGITTYTVQQQLANLKASGDYARIIGEVQAEIEREEREAAAALERIEAERRAAEEAEREAEAERKAAADRARKAKAAADKKRAEEEEQRAEAKAKLEAKRRREAEAEAEKIQDQARAASAAGSTARRASSKANERDITFDFAGVSKHLKNALQVSAFRDTVTQTSIAAILPVKRQAELAALLVQLARSRKTDITASFIRDNIMVQAQQMMGMLRKETADERRRREEHNVRLQMESHQGNFVRHLRGLNSVGQQIAELLHNHPHVDFPVSAEFRKAVSDAKQLIDILHGRFGYGATSSQSEQRAAVGQSTSPTRLGISR